MSGDVICYFGKVWFFTIYCLQKRRRSIVVVERLLLIHWCFLAFDVDFSLAFWFRDSYKVKLRGLRMKMLVFMEGASSMPLTPCVSPIVIPLTMSWTVRERRNWPVPGQRCIFHWLRFFMLVFPLLSFSGGGASNFCWAEGIITFILIIWSL